VITLSGCGARRGLRSFRCGDIEPSKEGVSFPMTNTHRCNPRHPDYWSRDMKLNLTLSAALLATTAPVYAQDIIELDEITVTAGYTDTNISDTGASVSVLQSDDLQNATTSIVQTFETVPGVSLTTSGGLGTQTYITVRGLNQNYVAVRVDGMDVTDPSGTQVAYDFGGLNAMGFGQAEFLKGSQSAIFGSEAVAGVVNLKSLASNELGERGSLTFETGSYGTVAANLSFEKVSEQGSAAIHCHMWKRTAFPHRKLARAKTRPTPIRVINCVSQWIIA